MFKGDSSSETELQTESMAILLMLQALHQKASTNTVAASGPQESGGEGEARDSQGQGEEGPLGEPRLRN